MPNQTATKPVVLFTHSSKNHRDAEGEWYYVEYKAFNPVTGSVIKTGGFGPVPKDIAEAIVRLPVNNV